MDLLTKDLLIKWKCSDYVDNFVDGKVDVGTLRILTDSEISQLIPVPGDRARFKENLKNWKYELDNLSTPSNAHPLNVSLSDSTLGSLFRESVDLIEYNNSPLLSLDEPPQLQHDEWGSSASHVTCAPAQVINKPTGNINAQGQNLSTATADETFQCGYVLKTLNSSLDGKAILNKRSIGKLEEVQRNLLVKLLIQPIIEKNPNYQFTNTQLLRWSLEIQELFNKESAALYYTPYVSALVHTTARNASGKLLRFVYNKRRQLRERGIIEPSGRSRSVSSTCSSSSASTEVAPLISLHAARAEATEEVSEKLAWLRNSLEPWQLVQRNWSLTAGYRLSRNYLCGTTLQESFNEYPVLKLPSGYHLLLDDFNHLYQDKTDGLFSRITSLRERIKLHAENKITSIRDKDVKQAIENYLKAINEAEDLDVKNHGALLLLPYIVSSVPLKSKKKSQWKPSKTEVRDGFITQIASDADLETTVSMRREKLGRYGKTLQPFVVFVGSSIANVSHCFVVAGDTYYRINKLLTAVDVCFKIIHATGARYQDEAFVVWMVIQRAFYDIVTPYDKELTSVKSLLIDLSL